MNAGRHNWRRGAAAAEADLIVELQLLSLKVEEQRRYAELERLAGGSL